MSLLQADRHVVLSSHAFIEAESGRRAAEPLTGMLSQPIDWLQRHAGAQNPPTRFKWQRQNLQVWLGAPWVRYLVLPAQNNLSTDTQRDAYARAMFAQEFGGLAQDWRVRVAAAAFNAPGLAAGIDRGLYDSLCALPRLHLTALRPLLMQACTRLPHLRPKEWGIVLAESGQLTCALYRNHSWQAALSLNQASEDTQSKPDLDAFLQQFAALTGFAPVETYYVSGEVSAHTRYKLVSIGAAHPLLDTPRGTR